MSFRSARVPQLLLRSARVTVVSLPQPTPLRRFYRYIGWFDLFDMQQEFKIFDSDGSGHVNKREFLQLTTALGLSLTKKERDKVFASLDLDNSGVVTFEEFHPWFKSVRAQTKRFVLGGNKRHWEEDLFLENHNSARLEAAE